MMASSRREFRRGRLFIISGPSGVGKSTLRKSLIEDLGLGFSVSATTRPPREGEAEGIDYEFISKTEFEQRIAQDHFLEWARVFGHYYGTPLKQLWRHVDAAEDVVLEIDVQGARQIQEKRDQLELPAYFIFISPPSLEELRMRLLERGTDTGTDIESRLREAEREMKAAEGFDLIVVNRDIKQALAEIEKFIQSVRGG